MDWDQTVYQQWTGVRQSISTMDWGQTEYINNGLGSDRVY